ncbi:MAG TPA: hypothetical protein VGM90_25065 [Kofleriaceae bacterium]
MKRAPASRQGYVIAAAALTLVAAGAGVALLQRGRATTSVAPEATRGPSATITGDAAPSAALDPLVQAMSTPPPDPAKMKLDQSVATSGGHVGVTFDHPVYSPANARSWIAIARVGAPDASYETWTYIEDGSQTAELVAPTQPGDYEMRMHDDYPQQTFHVVARLPFNVESGLAEDPDPPPQPSRAAEHFTLSAERFHTGAEIDVKFAAPLVAKKGEKYWITIASAGDADSSYGAWAYLPADATKTSMQAPSSLGKYEMRLHGNYPTKSTNVVFRVPFEVD